MELTDEQRIKSIKSILQKLHNPGHRDTGDKTEILINRTRDYPGITNNSPTDERFFAISGKDVYASGIQWSCGTVAKTFCYLNSIQPKDEQLELKILISTHPDHLIDSMVNHTLPCVKMGDGKWHAIEPQRNIVENRPRHPMYPDMPFIMDEIKVGNKIHHIMKHMVDVPFEIMAVMSWPEYEEKCSDLGNFLKIGSKRDKRTQMLLAAIETVLQELNSNQQIGNIYNFCTKIQDSKLPIRVIKAQNWERETLMLTINGEKYTFGTRRKYLMLSKLMDEIEQEYTIDEFIKMVETTVKKHSHER